jgi:hypothetical protein
MNLFQYRPWQTILRRALPLIIAFAVGSADRCFGVTATTTQTLSVGISALAKLSVPTSSTLTHSGTAFSPFSASFTMNYRARTTSSGGGSLALNAASDFTPSGGPSLSAGALSYTCSSATLGTACTGTMTVHTSPATSVVSLPAGVCTGGGGACSSSDPNTTSLVFTLTDSPSFSTGSYSTTLMFTASAI